VLKKKNDKNVCDIVAQVDGFMSQSTNSNVNARSVSIEVI
jgi:hypothetical protein